TREAPSTPAPTFDRRERPEPSSETPPTPALAQQRVAPRTVVASTDVAPSPHRVTGQFRDWFSRFQKESDAASKALLEAEGEALAKQRREVMARLIEEDPQRALEEAIPFAERQQLPGSITAQLEQPVSGRGSLSVLGVLPEPEAENPLPGIIRTAQINGQQYRAFVYGRRLA